MALRFYFTMEPDWRAAPLAFWVHVPVPGSPTACMPPVPACIANQGYRFLHVEIEDIDLQFSALPQLDHFIDVLQRKPVPTSRQLSGLRKVPVGPNSHWLSRLPAKLKAPKARVVLVQELRKIRQVLVTSEPLWC